jgi:hypothetical protein
LVYSKKNDKIIETAKEASTDNFERYDNEL